MTPRDWFILATVPQSVGREERQMMYHGNVDTAQFRDDLFLVASGARLALTLLEEAKRH